MNDRPNPACTRCPAPAVSSCNRCRENRCRAHYACGCSALAGHSVPTTEPVNRPDTGAAVPWKAVRA